jgi:hypothetical protein
VTEDVFAHVNISRSAVKNLSAIRADLEQSAVQRLTAENVEASNAAFGAANASTLNLRDSAIGVAAGDYVKIDDSRVLVLLAPRVSGNVKAYITLPAAFAFGVGYFLARRLVTSLFSRPNAS